MPVAKLDNSPRCQHVRMNGSPCAAPARRGNSYCVFHQAEHTKLGDYTLRIIEDAMTLQHSLYQVMRLLTDKDVDTKRAALLLYALQIAASNLNRLHQETHEIAEAATGAQEQSWIKELLQMLKMPETPEELAAETGAHQYLNPAVAPAPTPSRQPLAAADAKSARPAEPAGRQGSVTLPGRLAQER